ISHSPTAQKRHGTGSGRRTMPTTRSPARIPASAGACSTMPSDSWPRTRRSRPGGGQPYFPSMISMSVPQTPTARVRTRTVPSAAGGSGTSSRRAESATPGRTVSARNLRFGLCGRHFDAAVLLARVGFQRRVVGCAVGAGIRALDGVLGGAGRRLCTLFRRLRACLADVLGRVCGVLAGFLRRLTRLLGFALGGVLSERQD